MQEDKIEKIEKVGESVKSDKTDFNEDTTRAAPNKDQFNALLNNEHHTPPALVRTEASFDKNSLMDEVRSINHKVDQVSKASPAELSTQAQTVIAQIEEVKNKLATENLEIKGSVQTLLRNKLSHIDENLKIALNRAGLEYSPQPVAQSEGPTNLASPVEKFLGLLTHGQYELQRLSNDISQMGNDSVRMTPANMLAIQLKMGYIQQELELFANLLNKSLESVKTIMNVQV